MRKKWAGVSLVLLLTAIGLSGCATAPTGPSVLVLPGSGKTLEQFQGDDTFCRQWAAQEVTRTPAGETSGAMQWQYDMPYQQCMFAKGHRVPAAPALNFPPPSSQLPPPHAPAPPPAEAVPAPPQKSQ